MPIGVSVQNHSSACDWRVGGGFVDSLGRRRYCTQKQVSSTATSSPTLPQTTVRNNISRSTLFAFVDAAGTQMAISAIMERQREPLARPPRTSTRTNPAIDRMVTTPPARTNAITEAEYLPSVGS